MPVTNDRVHLDYVSRSWEQKQLIRDEVRGWARTERMSAIRTALQVLLLRPWQAAMFASDAVRLIGGALAAAVGSWWRAQAEWRVRQRAMGELHAMTDRELWDIGLRRSEIYWATHHGRPERAKPARPKTAAAWIAPTTSSRPDIRSGRETEANHTKRAA